MFKGTLTYAQMMLCAGIYSVSTTVFSPKKTFLSKYTEKDNH